MRNVDCLACIANQAAGCPGDLTYHDAQGVTHAACPAVPSARRGLRWLICTMFWSEPGSFWAVFRARGSMTTKSVDCMACIANLAARCPLGVPIKHAETKVTHGMIRTGRPKHPEVTMCQLTNHDWYEDVWGIPGTDVWTTLRT